MQASAYGNADFGIFTSRWWVGGGQKSLKRPYMRLHICSFPVSTRIASALPEFGKLLPMSDFARCLSLIGRSYFHLLQWKSTPVIPLLTSVWSYPAITHFLLSLLDRALTGAHQICHCKAPSHRPPPPPQKKHRREKDKWAWLWNKLNATFGVDMHLLYENVRHFI